MNFEPDKAPTFITLDDAVAFYKSRPQKSAAEYMAEISKIAQYYGAGIWQEKPQDCFFNQESLEKRLNELEITEEAEVVSIETATAPYCTSGVQPKLPQ